MCVKICKKVKYMLAIIDAWSFKHKILSIAFVMESCMVS